MSEGHSFWSLPLHSFPRKWFVSGACEERKRVGSSGTRLFRCRQTNSLDVTLRLVPLFLLTGEGDISLSVPRIFPVLAAALPSSPVLIVACIGSDEALSFATSDAALLFLPRLL